MHFYFSSFLYMLAQLPGEETDLLRIPTSCSGKFQFSSYTGPILYAALIRRCMHKSYQSANTQGEAPRIE